MLREYDVDLGTHTATLLMTPEYAAATYGDRAKLKAAPAPAGKAAPAPANKSRQVADK